MHTLTYTIASKLNNLQSFSSWFLYFLQINMYVKKFIFIPLHLSLPGCTKTPYFRGHNDKPVGRQISKTNWWCVFHLCAERERMHLLKKTGSITGVGPPLYPTRWHIRGSWQLFKCLCWQPTEDDNMPCERMTQVCHLIGGVYQRTAICCRSSCKWLLKVRPFATVYFTFLAFQCCQMLSKKQPWQWPLTFKKKYGISTYWTNIATKFARRGTMRSLFLSSWSSWHPEASATQWTEFERNTQSSTSPGESSARLPAGLRPHRHLWCHCQSTWSAQKRTMGIYSPRGRMAYRKRYVYGHASPNPPKTSPLWEVGPIII